MKKLKNNLKYLKISDILAVFKLFLSLPLALFFKLFLKITRKKYWLICESENTAHDNGYNFYCFMKSMHPEIITYYAIAKKCHDYSKVKNLGNIINFGSFRHYIYYLCAEYNISSQKNGNPNAIIFYIIHVVLKLLDNRIFLQHGITKDDAKWLYYKETNFHLFICGAKKEYEYIKEKFGYPKNRVAYTGFSRYDAFHNQQVNKKQIVIMPTWRNWLGRIFDQKNFENSSYYQHWQSLLHNQKLINFLEEKNLELIFYLHLNMQKYVSSFKNKSKNIKIVTKETADVQTILKESALLVTDYSSVYMDFAFMKKPTLYYQFDKSEYREKQYQEGYFSYEKNGFGPVVEKEDILVDNLLEIVKSDYQITDLYLNNINNFFELNDGNNSERIFQAINKKNILFVSYAMNVGGIETFLMRVLKHLDKKKYNPIFLCFGDQSFAYEKEIVNLGSRIIRVNNKLPFLKFIKEIKKIVKAENIAIIHDNTYYYSVHSLLAGFITGVKIKISHSHTNQALTDKRIFLKIKRFFLRRILNFLATDRLGCSKEANESLFGHNQGQVIYNGFEVEKFSFNLKHRESIRKSLNIAYSTKVIGNISRFQAEKNHHFLLNLFNDYQKINQDSKLLLIGEGILKEEILLTVKKLNLTDKVIVLNNQQDIHCYYNAMDLFILPSKYEGLGIVLIEAQANGLKCLASNFVPKEANITKTVKYLDFGSDWLAEFDFERFTPKKEDLKKYSISNTVKELENIYK